MVMRGKKRKGVRYFGPFAHAYAIRETLDLLLRTFPIRTCTNNKFQRHQRLGRPCLYAHIEKCVAPCVAAVEHDEYLRPRRRAHRVPRRRAPRRCSTGSTSRCTRPRKPSSSSAAARLRDQLLSVRKVIERQQMVGAKEEDLDVIGFAEDPLEASVQVFYVRRGRVTGRKGLVVDKVEDVDPPELVARILEQLYGDAPAEDVPREVLVPVEPDERDLYEEFLTLTREKSKVRIRVPQRGEKRRLLETVTHNAQEAFARHKLKRGVGPQRARPGAGRAAGGARSARGAVAHRVLRHLEPAGHRDRRVDDRARGRPPEAVGLPALQGPPRDPGRLRGDGRGAGPPVPPLPRGARRGGPGGQAGSRTPRTCSSSTAARVSSTSRCACSRSSGSRTSASSASPSGSKRSTSRASRTRCASPGTPRRSTCCSRCATRPTGSRSPTTASCATSR